MEEQSQLFSGLLHWVFQFAQWLTIAGEWLNKPLTFKGSGIIPINFTITPLALILGPGILAIISIAIFKTFFKWF